MTDKIQGWIQKDSIFNEVEIVVAEDVIASVEETGITSDFETDDVLLPGFIDIHNHGAVGVDVNSADHEALLKVSAFLASNGVTAWIPTIVPDTDTAYQNAIFAIEDAMDMQEELPVAQILGVHYEGIFANQLMCGALHKEHFRSYANPDDLDTLPVPERGVRMMTLAPEVEGGIELIRRLQEKSWFASIGHTNASPDILDDALEAGATHLTHFFNAMTGLHHRDRGVVGWALTEDVTFDIIADGVHVDPRMLDLAIQAKGSDRVALISDSIAPTGLGDGEYQVWGESISVQKGKTANAGGSIAGSVITLADSMELLLNMGLEFEEISHMSSFVPSKLFALENRGALKEGMRADVVSVSNGKVERVWIAGKEVIGG